MSKQKPIQLSIPQPCNEGWAHMTPQEQGRYCNACQKCVVDFTNKSDEDIFNFFTNNRAQNTCGRFREDQLNRQIFKPTTRRKYYQWFISLGFIVFLSNLIGFTAKAQEPVKKEFVQDKKTNNKKDTGYILGKATDENGNHISNVKVDIVQGGRIIDYIFTDSGGEYIMKGLMPGRYDLHASKSIRQVHIVTGIILQPNKTTEVNIHLDSDKLNVKDTTIVEYTVPIIDRYGSTTAQIITGGTFVQIPTRETKETLVNDTANTPQSYIIDGMKVDETREVNLIQDGIDVIPVHKEGLPAKYSSYDELK